MKRTILSSLFLLAIASAVYAAEDSSPAPVDCPFKPSNNITGIRFTGRHAEYTDADTWYPSWATDGKMYSPWTDGAVNGVCSNSAGKDATTGCATIIGEDPLHLTVTDQAVYVSDPSPYESRYPCGLLVYDGVWYYGTYCLGGGQVTKHKSLSYNWTFANSKTKVPSPSGRGLG